MSNRIDFNKEMAAGFQTACINGTYQSNLAYRPEFLSNNYKKGKKVLVSIEQELLTCDEFKISVAFITNSGITPLLQVLKDLEKKNVPGEILTTDYLSFSEPDALEKLASLKNIKLKMFRTTDETGGFHTKGYIFRQEEIYRIIIGSSNMTLSAVTRNREWNTKIVSTEQGEIAKDVLDEFHELWNSTNTKDYDEFIDQYRLDYLKGKMIRQQRKAAMQEEIIELDRCRLVPNKMQVAFVNNILELRADNVEKAMLLSSTGTGKTMASAFAMRELKPKRMLFVVHREQIAKQALSSYRRIFGSSKSYGLLSGNQKDMDADCMFSTMQMMAKPEIHEQFDQNTFDIIVLDECHHAGSDSYQRIMNYFKPQFWLGMTASPDTNNYDIYDLFDHNIAYEIRLQQALEEDLLCPFHYFGITDLEINGQVFDDNAGLQNFSNLVSDARVDYVIEKAEYFGYSGDRVKGLIFCSRKEEARELSEKFNKKRKKDGNFYRTTVLTGEDNQSTREEVINRLTDDEHENYQLDYIFTVDIFNEGVDIPEINQVIMLRPTQSPVVFVQQLGRGLRKFDGKEYVVILDFIGNYTNNFMIPMALSGDRSYNKDSVRKYVREGSRVIPGSSTIHFDEISRKRIYESLDAANFNDIKLIKDCYNHLKFKLGHIPCLMDFENYGSIDPIRIFDSKSLGSYHKFLSKYEKEYEVKFTPEQEKVLEFISKKFGSGKRAHELLVLKRLLRYQHGLMRYLKKDLADRYNLDMTEKTRTNVVNILTNGFTTGSAKSTYEDAVLIQEDGSDYKISDRFADMLEDKDFYKAVEEVLDFGLFRNQKDYGDLYENTSFQLYAKYTYEDVCRLLEWEKGEVALNIGGYKYDKNTKTYPVFINYDKTDDISDTTKYEDRFISENTLIAISKSGRTLKSEDVYTAMNAEKLGVSMELFVRKNKDDKISKEFYYLGRMKATGEAYEFIMPNTTKTAVEIYYHLDTPIREDVYDYIVK